MSVRRLPLANILVILLLSISNLTVSLPTPPDALVSLASTNTTQWLQKRQCVRDGGIDEDGYETYDCDDQLPTMNEWVIRLRDEADHGKALPENHALFYTGLLGTGPGQGTLPRLMQWIGAWIEAKKQDGDKFYWWYEHVNADWRRTQAEYIRDNPSLITWSTKWGSDPYSIFDFCNFQALSAAAINPVAILLTPRGSHPKDHNWSPNSAWQYTEFWALTQNPNIQTIVRADPRPADVLEISDEEWCEHSKVQVLWERDVDSVEEIIWECQVAYDEDGNPIEVESDDEESSSDDDDDDSGPD